MNDVPDYGNEPYQGSSPTLQSNPNIMVQTTGDGSVARRVAAPRNLGKIRGDIKILASMASDDWYYRWPTKNRDGTVGWVEGPSIKCAMAVARTYGNCEVDCSVEDAGTHIIFMGHFVDLETGFSVKRPFRQRKGQNIGGKMDAERAADIVFQIGVSKATRNVICNALETFADFALEEAKNSILASIEKNMDKARKKIELSFRENGIDVKRVEYIYAKAMKDWMAPDIAQMVAEVRAIADGMVNKDDTYPATPEEKALHEKQAEDIAKKAADVQSGKTSEAKQTTNWDSILDELTPGLWGAKSEREIADFVAENSDMLKTISDKAPDAVKERWSTEHANALSKVRRDAQTAQAAQVEIDKSSVITIVQEEPKGDIKTLPIPARPDGKPDWMQLFSDFQTELAKLKTPAEFAEFEAKNKGVIYDLSRQMAVKSINAIIDKGKGAKK